MADKSIASAEAQRALAAFPAAGEGQVRWVVWLEQQPEEVDESSLMVQVRAGVQAQVDGVNHYRLSGQLQVRSVEGWGYDCYHYEGESQVASTRMGAKAGSLQEATVWSTAQLIRYNSRLPLVVYTPVHISLAYRVLAPSSEYCLVSTG